MLHNNISNVRNAVIGVRCENTLFKLKDGIIPMPFHYRLKHSEVNKKVLNLVNYLFWETEMTVVLIIDDEHYSTRVEEYIDNFPFGQIYNVKSLSEVTMMLNTGDLSYFIDNDKIELHNLNSKYAMDFDTFNGIIKRNRKVVRYET